MFDKNKRKSESKFKILVDFEKFKRLDSKQVIPTHRSNVSKKDEVANLEGFKEEMYIINIIIRETLENTSEKLDNELEMKINKLKIKSCVKNTIMKENIDIFLKCNHKARNNIRLRKQVEELQQQKANIQFLKESKFGYSKDPNDDNDDNDNNNYNNNNVNNTYNY